MPLPRLCLLPHEVGDLAPDIALCAPADWRVKTHWFGGEHLARAVTFEGDNREIVVRHQGRRDAPLLRLNISKLAVENDENEDLIVNDIRMGQFERSLAYNADGNWVCAPDETRALLRLSCFGETFWANQNDEYFRFVWSGFDSKHRFDEQWRARTSDTQIEREVAQMLGDLKSDCSFARTWLLSSHGERQQLIYSVGRGSLAQVEALLRAVFTNGAHETASANWHLSLNLSVGAGTEFYQGGATEIARRSYLSNGDDARPLAPHEIRLVELILRHFELWRNWHNQKFTVVQGLWRDERCHWEIPFAAPSMHDVLEARLLLRGFLIGKISVDEMGELLSET